MLRVFMDHHHWSMNFLALDIDGVLIPCGKLSPEDEMTRVHADYQGTFQVSMPMMQAIDSLPAEKIWLTTWGNEANEAFSSIFGELPVLKQPNWTPALQHERWWKTTSLLKWIKAAPATGTKVTSVVWFEDEAYNHTDDMVWLITELLGLGVPFKMIETNSTRGLQPEHIEQARAFFAS